MTSIGEDSGHLTLVGSGHMKVALTTNVLRVPPTYFVTSHAQQLAHRHEFEVFALLADIRDVSVSVPIRDFAAFPRLSTGRRVYLAPFAGRSMTAAIRRFEPDIVHQHFATWSRPAIAAAAHNRVPLVTTLHGYDVRVLASKASGPLDVWHRQNVRAIQKQSDRVLSVSKYLADEAISVGFDSSRLEVHYQGIDTDFFTPLGDASTSREAPIVSFVGALDTHKGPLDLVEASLRNVRDYEHRLLLVGSGPLESRLRELADEYPHIELLGSVERSRVRDLLRRSRVMVLPSQQSQGGREAAGLVLLEAQSCGTPVVAYNSGGIAEMIDADRSGVLVAEQDIAALSSALRGMLELSEIELAQMSAAARDFVVTERSLKRSCVELERHYADLVAD